MSSTPNSCAAHTKARRASVEGRSQLRRTPSNRHFAAASLILLAHIATQPLVAQDLRPDRCYRIDFPTSRPIQWPTSGAWSQGGSYFYTVDTYQDKIWTVSLADGRVADWSQLVSTSSSRQLQPKEPMQLRPADGGWMLLQGHHTAEIQLLDIGLEPLESIQLQERSFSSNATKNAETRLKRIYDFAQVGSGILAFADFETPAGGHESAFFYFDPNGRYEVFHRVATEEPYRSLYLRNLRHITAIDTTGYILTLDGLPRITRVQPGIPHASDLAFFPERFQSRPRLGNLPTFGPRKATENYKRLEAAQMAVGLYAWDQHLYLLGKESIAPNGETAWSLVSLDPRNGKELSSTPLPTVAAHLTVVPGRDFWGLIERDPVEGVGKIHAPFMDTPSLLLVPTTWLEDPSGSPLLDDSKVLCAAVP